MSKNKRKKLKILTVEKARRRLDDIEVEIFELEYRLEVLNELYIYEIDKKRILSLQKRIDKNNRLLDELIEEGGTIEYCLILANRIMEGEDIVVN